jgi:hypothetical protein
MSHFTSSGSLRHQERSSVGGFWFPSDDTDNFRNPKGALDKWPTPLLTVLAKPTENMLRSWQIEVCEHSQQQSIRQVP